MKESYDVVVIGSGFGGAITSGRLAQAGRSVCILEQGREWDKTDFPRSPGEVSRAFWRENESYGFLEYKAFKKIDVIQGCGVGGGSLHYFNVHLRTPAAIFERDPWPEKITRPLLDRYYDLAEGMLESKPIEPPAGRELPLKTQAFLAAADKLHAEGKIKNPGTRVPIGVFTAPERNHPISGKPQEPCNYSGNCLIGCVLHAKNTLDLNYLPLARQNGAELFALHQADKIEPLSDDGYRVHFKRLDPNQPGRSEPGSVRCKQVVVAAGTLGTNRLLLSCRDVHQTLPYLSPLLGGRFSGNGDFLFAVTKKTNRDIDPARGPSITAGADFSTKDNLIYIEDLGFPDPFIWMLEGILPNLNRVSNLVLAGWSYLLDMVGIRHGRLSVEVDRLFQGGTTTRMLPYLGMGTDAADGYLRLKNNAIDIDWDPKQSMQMFREMEAGLKALSRALDGKYVTSFLWKWPFRRLLTAHPMGGCVMGDDPATSVVSDQGEVWGHPNLFVADAALIPTALSVNPSLTISALAERVAFHMIHGREMAADDAARPANR